MHRPRRRVLAASLTSSAMGSSGWPAQGGRPCNSLLAVQVCVLGPLCSPLTQMEDDHGTGNDTGQRSDKYRRDDRPADASSKATTTSICAGRRLGGAPRRNRTGDPILTMNLHPPLCEPAFSRSLTTVDVK